MSPSETRRGPGERSPGPSSFGPDRDRVAAFIRANLPLAAAPSLPQIQLHTAHPASGLRRLTESDDGPPPYWAYRWAGGLVLARHLLDHPETVAGRRVLDLGTGSGVVAIAAALAGAQAVCAVDVDPHAVVAAGLNAAANGVSIVAIEGDLTGGPPPPDVDVILVGDLFYAPDLAARVGGLLDRCVAVGLEVLVGDPGRTPLPLSRLRPLARRPAHDFGDAADGEGVASAVYAYVGAG